MKGKYHGIGLMSGTSMDGIDICHCTFTHENDNWDFEIITAETLGYSDQWYARLVNLQDQSAEIFAKTHIFYGRYLGQVVKDFIAKHNIKLLDFIASHGQTIFHNPQKGYTIQIGSGAEIAALTGIPTIVDLRSSDLAQGGQGAPIVPLGEKYLFPEYNSFINIGGISNISIHQAGTIIGYDVCMGNLLLDLFAQKLGFKFDAGGAIAKTGTPNNELVEALNSSDFFKQKPPKSLDASVVIDQSLEIIGNLGQLPEKDILSSLVEHITDQLTIQINEFAIDKVLLTGGGALNNYLIQTLQKKSTAEIIIPQPIIIEFKEALIMAFLGLKRLLKQANVMSSVTGAKIDTINGALYI